MAAPRRARRRRTGRILLVAAAASALILVANGVRKGHATVAENTQFYIDTVSADIRRSTEEGTDLADIRNNAARLGREGLVRRLDRLARDARSIVTSVGTVIPPLDLRTAQAYLLTALGVRARAVQEARTAMDQAVSQGPTDPAVNGLVSAGQDLQLADKAYSLFAGELPGGPISVPASVWVSNPLSWDQVETEAFVTTLRSSATLVAVHDLAIITFSTDPAPVGVQNGAQVLPATPILKVSLVVANVGNQPEKNVTVTVTLQTNTGESQGLRDFVNLAPGQRFAETLQSLHPVAGTSGTLTVAAVPVPGETNLANNALSTAVLFR